MTVKGCVFVIWFNDFHYQDNMIGIYATKEGALKRIAGFTPQDKLQMRIDEETVEN